MATKSTLFKPSREALPTAAPMTTAAAEPIPIENHFTATEVAGLWKFDVETIRRLFDDEPGVVVLQAPAKKGKRPYKTIRIPQTVLDRVHRRLQR
jgi:hypothetical protein